MSTCVPTGAIGCARKSNFVPNRPSCEDISGFNAKGLKWAKVSSSWNNILSHNALGKSGLAEATLAIRWFLNN